MLHRLSTKTLQETENLEELYHKMFFTVEGEFIGPRGCSTFEDFYNLYCFFTEHICKLIPDMTLDEFLKFDRNYSKLQEIYSWKNSEYYIKALEFEINKKL